MIVDYTLLLNSYAFPKSVQETKSYLENYWLNEIEYAQIFIPIKNSIFNPNFHWFPDLIFNQAFKIKAFIGGFTLTENKFAKLKACFKEMGDKYFVIIEDRNEGDAVLNSSPALRFKYPVNILWNEINMTSTGNIEAEGISYELFQRPVRNYFIFGDSGKWGNYIANDFETPIDIVGSKLVFAPIIDKLFPQPIKEINEIKKVLPENYKNLIP